MPVAFTPESFWGVQDLLELKLLSDGGQENHDDNDKAAGIAGGGRNAWIRQSNGTK